MSVVGHSYPERLRTRMTDEEVDLALGRWNAFAAEWTRRELDERLPFPAHQQSWSDLEPVGGCGLLMFGVKSDERCRMFALRLRKGTKTWGRDWSFARPRIPRKNVLGGWVYWPKRKAVEVKPC